MLFCSNPSMFFYLHVMKTVLLHDSQSIEFLYPVIIELSAQKIPIKTVVFCLCY